MLRTLCLLVPALSTLPVQSTPLSASASAVPAMELERMERALWGTGRQAWEGDMYESARCPLDDPACACLLESDPFKTRGIVCGKDHVICDIAMASYGTSVRGACSSTPGGLRALQQGTCVTRDAAGGCSARTVVTRRCRGKSHCLLNRCTMLPNLYPVSPCMANIIS